ncbi:hypothetical protein BGW80DRAFT_245957 [Lactifluus volemus]|nr:hypothetical protein BGW80DRAFT_245957 [Lactifluus volemus]
MSPAWHLVTQPYSAEAIFWTVQLIPRLIKTWRTKSTEGLSPWLVNFHKLTNFRNLRFALNKTTDASGASRRSRAAFTSSCSIDSSGSLLCSRGASVCSMVLRALSHLYLLSAGTHNQPSYRRGTPASKTGVKDFELGP